MTDKELRGLGPALADYLDRYLFCCAYTQTFAHLGTYVRGLLSDLERKTCEPIALKAGTPVRSLQEFLRDHVWDFERVKQLHQLHSAELLQQPDDAHGLGTIGLIDETSAAKKGDQTPGVQLDWLTFDEEYGKSPGFVAGLGERELRFVGEVPRSLSCRAVNRPGNRPQPHRKGCRAEEVVRTASRFRSQSWQVCRLPREVLPDQVWRVKAARVWLHSKEGWSAGTYWLIWASNDETGEEKFFLSNAPEGAEVETLVRVAFRRWNVEHSFRVAKSELGFTHFEGRNYTALMRHMSLCLVAMGFVADHTDRLRKDNPEITLEQVCRALRVVSRRWLRRQRGSSDDAYELEVIDYHQERNRAARLSKKKRPVLVRDRKKPRPRRRKRQQRSTTAIP